MKKYKAAIIGCGRIGSEFDDDTMLTNHFGISSHAGAYNENSEIELVAAADISNQQLKTNLKRF